jgi:hypothetical protein
MALVDGVTCDDAALAWGGCAAAVVRPRRMMRTAEWRMTRRRAFSRECAAFFGTGRNGCGYSSGARTTQQLGIMYAFLTPWLRVHNKKWSTTKAQNSVSRNQPFSSHSFFWRQSSQAASSVAPPALGQSREMWLLRGTEIRKETTALHKTHTLLIRTCSKRAFEAAGNRG